MQDLYVGYRYYDFNPSQCRFPFGHGLSYTTFELSNLTVTRPKPYDAEFSVSVEIANTGDLAGAEVVQVYIQDLVSSLPRPYKELKGIRRVHLQPGEIKSVTLDLDKRALGFWDEADGGSWRAEEGDFAVLVGTSSANVPLQKVFALDSVISWRGL